MTAADIAAVLHRRKLPTRTEAELQDAIEDALIGAGVEYTREARLTATERIDFLVGSIGIEVKIGGQTREVARQLIRYVETGKIIDLLLVSTKALHRELDGSKILIPPPAVCGPHEPVLWATITVVRPRWL